MRALKQAVAAAFSVACVFASLPCLAQQYLIGAGASLSSGLEGGGKVGPWRARTRLRLGGDLRVDESPEDILGFGLLAEIEPHSAFGADVRYERAVGERFRLDAGVLGILAPSSLYGVSGGLVVRLPISKKAQVELGPEGDFFFLGSDLPDGVVIWQFRLQGGLRVDL